MFNQVSIFIFLFILIKQQKCADIAAINCFQLWRVFEFCCMILLHFDKRSWGCEDEENF